MSVAAVGTQYGAAGQQREQLLVGLVAGCGAGGWWCEQLLQPQTTLKLLG